LDDVCDVFVGQAIGDLASPPASLHQAGSPQDPQVLGHQGLVDANGVHQFMDAALRVCELYHDGDAVGIGQGPEEVGGVLRLLFGQRVPGRRHKT
jgi:hypothetical protein